MHEGIARYQMVKSLEEIPKNKLFRYIYPHHVRTYCRQDNTFFVQKITLGIPLRAKNEDIEREQAKIDSIEKHYGLTRDEVFSALLELFGGEQGFYVADLKNRKYFYRKNYDDLEPLLTELGATVV